MEHHHKQDNDINNRETLSCNQCKKVMDDYLIAWNSHDINKILSFFTDDGIYEDVAHGITNHGKKEITGYLNTSFIDFPDLKIEVKTVFGTGDWIVVEIITSVPMLTVAGLEYQLPARLFLSELFQSFNYVMIRLADNQSITTTRHFCSKSG